MPKEHLFPCPLPSIFRQPINHNRLMSHSSIFYNIFLQLPHIVLRRLGEQVSKRIDINLIIPRPPHEHHDLLRNANWSHSLLTKLEPLLLVILVDPEGNIALAMQ